MTDTEPDKLIAIVCFLSLSPLFLNLDPRVENTWKREKWTISKKIECNEIEFWSWFLIVGKADLIVGKADLIVGKAKKLGALGFKKLKKKDFWHVFHFYAM